MATILIVGDRQSDREDLVRLLASGGHRLFQAADGAGALATAWAEHPDLIITDILMPTMDGSDFILQLRKDRTMAETPVIFYMQRAAELEQQVHETKRTQEALRESEERFLQLEDQFRQSQKMAAVGQLAAGVAHDFNNLLTIINGYSDIIQTELAPDSAVRELVHEIGQAGERAASLTRQLLAFSRKDVLDLKHLNLNAIVTDTAKMLQHLIGEDIALHTVLETGLGQVKADPGQIEQILMNLVVNARDAMAQGGNLTIETSHAELDEAYTQAYPELAPGPYVMMAVSDTGTGMDELTKARVFEPFFTTKGPGKGTGLGLATVYGIVKQSKGHITVSSKLGQGTTFTIYLPLVQGVVSPAKADSNPEALLRGNETIVLAEDEPAVRALARHVLQSHGYTVLEAEQSDKVLAVAEAYQGTIHLLVTDAVMPGMSGRQLADRLATIRPGLKVLYLSGYPDDPEIQHGVLEAEASVLRKPFTPTSLAAKVREILDQHLPSHC